MQDLLGAEYPAFLASYDAPDVHALRRNGVKADGESLSLLPFTPSPLPFGRGCYLIPPGERPGTHPLHHAGAYYMQDPSAMATVAALPFPIAGWRVLDLCAAPGGKTAQLADLIGEAGTLISNEIVPARARILLGNIERLGLSNTAVTSTDPATVASMFDRYFDLVVVDAPCSGEGMFRKYPEAAAEWSPAAVEAAAARSRLILRDACRTVAEGGYLLFSTCTFSEEENEDTVTAFLAAHPDFSLVPISPAVAALTSPGIERPHRPADITRSRRYYPHNAPGEGQYIALFRRTAGGRGGLLFQESDTRVEKKTAAALSSHLSALLDSDPPTRLSVVGDTVIKLPEGMPIPPRGLVRAGVALGSLSGKLFLPHHHAAMALGRAFRGQLPLSLDDPRLAAYLAGEEIPADPALSGFCAVTVAGIPLGLVKCSSGRAKNHYPKGLRTR
jgi:16S rRNA C967 or C1407 C5-methylase (RsmB/RsmF family)/NOL1/NOP2/fmu family ribosome biogenesis protein